MTTVIANALLAESLSITPKFMVVTGCRKAKAVISHWMKGTSGRNALDAIYSE